MTNFAKIVFALVLLSSYFTITKASGACWAAPDLYGPKCDDTQGIFGSAGLNVVYTINAKENTGTMICCKVKGFKNTVETWFDIGCASGTLTATVPWGNVLAVKGVQCKGIPFGCFVEF